MAWLESHQALRDHPKKDRLAELLFNGTTPNDVADMAAVGVLHHLWWWALDYAQDGDLSKFTDRQIAKGCKWNGDGTLLVQALVDAGFIDAKPRQIHDWGEYAGRLIVKREQDRERKAKWRASTGQDADAPRDGAGTNRPTNLKSAGGRANRSAVSPARAEDPQTCWRCEHPITGDEILDDKCVTSSRGIRHKDCTAVTR
jgi:hypothetical protein